MRSGWQNWQLKRLGLGIANVRQTDFIGMQLDSLHTKC